MAPGRSLQLPQDWTAAVFRADGTRVGLGVLVKPHFLVTCAHVVEEALEIHPSVEVVPPDPVTIETILDRRRARGRVVRWHPVDDRFISKFQDICLIELDGPELGRASWDDLLQQEPQLGSRVRVFGYPGGPPGRISTGNLLAGSVDNGWWQLDPPANPPTGFTAISPGFSGSLAWDMDREKAVGIVVAKTGSGTGTISYLIPSALLYEACRASQQPATPVQVPTGLDAVALQQLLERFFPRRDLIEAWATKQQLILPPEPATADQIWGDLLRQLRNVRANIRPLLDKASLIEPSNPLLRKLRAKVE